MNDLIRNMIVDIRVRVTNLSRDRVYLISNILDDSGDSIDFEASLPQGTGIKFVKTHLGLDLKILEEDKYSTYYGTT